MGELSMGKRLQIKKKKKEIGDNQQKTKQTDVIVGFPF